MKNWLVLFLFVMAARAHGEAYLAPSVAFGQNSAQKSFFLVGIDIGYQFDENWAAGVGGYVSAGNEWKHDREVGVGPFVSFTERLTSSMTFHARQEFNYVDLHDPYEVATPTGTIIEHHKETGVASVTSLGFHFAVTKNIGFGMGYRLVVGLSNDKLDDGRSGPFLGFGIGF